MGFLKLTVYNFGWDIMVNYYVDKLEFHKLLKEYKYTKSKQSYEKIGKIFLTIAYNYLNKPFYINYTDDWKGDMVSEAVLDMIRYIHNYDVDRMETQYIEEEKIPDPFSYFSQYVYNGIMRYLKSKKKDDILVRLPFIENLDKREFTHE